MTNQTTIIRDHHLNKGDKVEFNNLSYTFKKMDGAYAKWTNEQGKAFTGNFNYLVYEEDKKLYTPYKADKK